MENSIKITKRFVLSQNGIKNNLTMQFTNKKGITYTYNQKEVFENNKERFESMNCWTKYKTYTNTNNIPTFAREFATEVK